jgi:hypothetical protein
VRFKRVYHPVHLWEEINFNMWGEVDDRAAWIEKAISFTGDHEKYGYYMLRVIREWPISCENALTDYSLSQKAWVGHAACALGIRCPEDIVRAAWGKLSDERQFLANKAAARAIQQWSISYAESKGLPEQMGGALLS